MLTWNLSCDCSQHVAGLESSEVFFINISGIWPAMAKTCGRWLANFLSPCDLMARLSFLTKQVPKAI